MKGYHVGDCLDLLGQLEPSSVHCVITSPPYYALRSYLPDGHPSKEKEIGSEPTLDAFLATMVAVFRAVWRVLRDDGTLWLNIGDSYSAGKTGRSDHGSGDPKSNLGPKKDGLPGGTPPGPVFQRKAEVGIPPKNLLMVPARVALALQADGWILRSDIIWAKPNPMPESCRDRPTNAHEHLFLFSKRARYFYDGDAVRCPLEQSTIERSYAYKDPGASKHFPKGETGDCNPGMGKRYVPAGRNLRNVWTIPTQAVKHKHYATFPEKLVEPCIKAGTSQEGVCVECGAPWERVVERETVAELQAAVGAAHDTPKTREIRDSGQRNDGLGYSRKGNAPRSPIVTTTGWRPTCECKMDFHPQPKTRAVVLDPFMGSGTVARVAERLGREWIGFDLDERNAEMCELRLKRNQMELVL
jgi:DNA modification methylase